MPTPIDDPAVFRDRIDWLSTGTLELGYTVRTLLSVSTKVEVNRLPATVWSELAIDPDPEHLSSFAREDLAEFLIKRARLTEQNLSTPDVPATSMARRVHGTAVDLLETEVWVQTLGDLVRVPGMDLDLQANPDVSPEGDGVAAAAETEAEAAPVPAARDPFPSRCSACGGTGGQHFRNCPIYPH
jgi:hypothetical protein